MNLGTRGIINELLSSVCNQSAQVKRVAVGVHWTVVESDLGCGMASTLSQPPPHYNLRVKDAGTLEQKSAYALASYLRSDIWLEASIGMAALNSLIKVDETLCERTNAYDVLREKGAGKNVAIIGHFPFVEKLKNGTAQLWILEKEPRDGDTPASQAHKILPKCDVLGISATTLINGTLSEILSCCKSDAFKMLIGPSTPMTPKLFNFGLDALAGCKIMDPDLVFKNVGQGATFGQVQGVQLLIMQQNH